MALASLAAAVTDRPLELKSSLTDFRLSARPVPLYPLIVLANNEYEGFGEGVLASRIHGLGSYYLCVTKRCGQIQQIKWGKGIIIKNPCPWQAMLDIEDGHEQPNTCHE